METLDLKLVPKRNLRLGASGALATIFVERVFDGLTITLILVVTLLAYPFQAEMQQIALIAAAIFGALFCFIIFGTFSDIPLRILRFFRSKSPKFALFLFDIAEKFLNGAATLRSFRRIAAVLLLSFAVWAVELSLYLLVSAAFDVNIPFAGYLVMLCAANLGMLAAPTPGGLGVFQSAIVLALESFAIVYEKRMAVVILLFRWILGFRNLLLQQLQLINRTVQQQFWRRIPVLYSRLTLLHRYQNNEMQF